MNQRIEALQHDLQVGGFYEGDIDGNWGPISQAAWEAALQSAKLRCDAAVPSKVAHVNISLAWSAKVSPAFCDKVLWIASNLKMPSKGPDWLMGCMAWESGETFSPAVVNMAGSGATGLIQFMPRTAVGLGTTTEALAKMTPEQQLDYVYRYFLPYRGRLNSLADVYMAILWPAGIGKPAAWVLWDAESRPTTYRQNAGLDINRDQVITKAEATAKVQAKLDKGLRVEFRRAA
ncbi:hypothetical protein [Halopseudomonas laoshanensis]|uniref:hypothetical protein n=1 Tax=Halopseudomonas laoshanensis TaxID=2268758 RepID=UPI0037351048